MRRRYVKKNKRSTRWGSYKIHFTGGRLALFHTCQHTTLVALRQTTESTNVLMNGTRQYPAAATAHSLQGGRGSAHARPSIRSPLKPFRGAFQGGWIDRRFTIEGRCRKTCRCTGGTYTFEASLRGPHQRLDRRCFMDGEKELVGAREQSRGCPMDPNSRITIPKA